MLFKIYKNAFIVTVRSRGSSVPEWLACCTQALRARIQIAVATLSGNSLRQTVHTHRASWRRGVVVSGVRRTNEVNARRARLLLGWVTVSGRVYHLGM